MFVDVASVTVIAGRGGDGAVSFRHEKYIDKGGPDGGDGGRGGDIVFVGDENTNTLVDFRYHPELKAEPGSRGEKRNKRGKSGGPLFVKIPLGTIVTKDGEVIADITKNKQKVVVAHGGDGGFGNAHFKSSTRQSPRVAELGENGESFEAKLELKLIADVGLVGFPNAGKSTFLSVVSNARPEIADYAFTTLSPNLGVADIDSSSLLVADIPGLIEGASKGKGLGIEFLRHVERTSVLLHLIDAYNEDVEDSYKKIRAELKAHNPELVNRSEVVALTKIEGLDQEILSDQLGKVQSVVEPDVPIFAISSSAHIGIKELLRELVDQVKQAKSDVSSEEIEVEDALPTISLTQKQVKEKWNVEKQKDTFVITGEKIERFARRTDYGNVHSLNRLRDILKKTGITHELTRQGAEGASEIKIGNNQVFTLLEQ